MVRHQESKKVVNHLIRRDLFSSDEPSIPKTIPAPGAR